MVRRLAAVHSRAVVLIDNCGPDLHRELATACKNLGQVSVLTIEYDVRDDLPEETLVFRLRPASSETVQAVVGAHHPHISEVDRRSIAEFAGGNARIALSLAGTVSNGESLAGLRDVDLFQRLFLQRYADDEGVLRTAGACALLYSFNATDPDFSESEIPRLAAVAEQSAHTVFRNIELLCRRDLGRVVI